MSKLMTCPNCGNSEIQLYYVDYEDEYYCPNCGEFGPESHFYGKRKMERLVCPNCGSNNISLYSTPEKHICKNCGEIGFPEHFTQYVRNAGESGYKLIGEKEIILRFLVAQKISCVVNGKYFLADAIPTHDEQYFHVCCATFTENDVKQIYCVNGNGYVVELK